MKRSAENEQLITQADLRAMLNYDPDTGFFSWAIARRGVAIGQRAGFLQSHGYRQIQINGPYYYAHRLVWVYVYGYWPDRSVDHRNLDKDDNRIVNLRLATADQNSANSRARRGTQSGKKGVVRARGRWAAQITVAGRCKKLGHFSTIDEAHAAYCKAAQEAHGEFWRAE